MKEHVLEALREKYLPLSVEQRFHALFQDFHPSRILCTSSFGSSSLYLLDYLTRAAPDHKVHFIDTGNHFPETLAYRDRIAAIMGLNTEVITAPEEVHHRTRREKTWETDSTYCCYLKKVAPIEKISPDYDVWISGLMEWQNAFRAGLRIFEYRNGMLRFYPLLDKTEAEFEAFVRETKVPQHPLVEKGYASIGCIPCTLQGTGREGRWTGSGQMECGLHQG